eukprot:13674838-Alexandrium_andersonii.AAC.1
MSASLVGSEMCIRDRLVSMRGETVREDLEIHPEARSAMLVIGEWSSPVSYTHLTLPTICSV